jgi:L-rhamnose mutarotase
VRPARWGGGAAEAETGSMIKEAFSMRLKPGAFAEYKRLHDEIWPELVEEIERAGVINMTIWQNGLDMLLVSEVRDAETWERLRASEVHQRWSEVIWPLLEPGADGTPLIRQFEEIFHLPR